MYNLQIHKYLNDIIDSINHLPILKEEALKIFESQSLDSID